MTPAPPGRGRPRPHHTDIGSRATGHAAAAIAAALLVLVASLLVPAALGSDSARTAAAAPARYGLFADDVPTRVDIKRKSRPKELGMRFRPNVSGTVTGAEVYKAAHRTDVTPTSASLWDRRGRRLATVDIPAKHGAGWIAVEFRRPVQVVAGQRYTVSVFAPRGHYAVTKRGFRTSVRNEALIAPGRRNGVHRRAASSTYPTRTARATNFWVDVIFEPGDDLPIPLPTTTLLPTPTETTSTPTGTPTPTGSPTPTQSPTPTGTTSPSPTSSPTTTPPDATRFPTADTAGVPEGWTPRSTFSGTYRVTQAGAVVEDIRVNGDIIVEAKNVTLRRVEVVGGRIDNFVGPTCQNGLLVEDSTVRRGSGSTTDGGTPAIGHGGFTARRVEINGLPEGFRVGGRGSGCGPVAIHDSYARVVRPDVCNDWHGDGIQGYDGPALTVRQTTLELIEDGCGGTAPFFYPEGQGNQSVDIDGLLVSGGGISFRLGTPGAVQNLFIEKDTWYYGPIDVRCSRLSLWDADIATVSSSGSVTPVRSQPCNT